MIQEKLASAAWTSTHALMSKGSQCATTAMTPNTTQLEASHNSRPAMERLVATIERGINTTESEEDTPKLRRKLQRVLGVRFIAADTKKDRNLRLLLNCVKKRDW